MTARLFDIHRDGAIDFTADVVTTEHTMEASALDVKHNVIVHIRILRAAVDLPQIRETAQIDVRRTILRSLVTCTVGLINSQRTSYNIRLAQVDCGTFTHITLCVRTTECRMNEATMNFSQSYTSTVNLLSGIVRISCTTRFKSNKTHVGTWVLRAIGHCILTVTAGEHRTYLVTAVHLHMRSRCCGCITSTIHRLDTRIATTLNDDMGLSGIWLYRVVCRLIATAIDGLQVIRRTVLVL